MKLGQGGGADFPLQLNSIERCEIDDDTTTSPQLQGSVPELERGQPLAEFRFYSQR